VGIGVKLIGRLHEELIECGESRRIRSRFRAQYLGVAHARLTRDLRVLAPFVTRLAQVTDAQDHEFAFAQGQRGFEQHVVREHHPAPHEFRMVREGFEYIEGGTLFHERTHDLFDILVPLIRLLRFNTRLGQTHDGCPDCVM
jgi:hypothetical protein